jgi:hypothetical protein
MSVTDEINKAIEEAGGSVRDALNIALARIKILERELQNAKDGVDYLGTIITCKDSEAPHD